MSLLSVEVSKKAKNFAYILSTLLIIVFFNSIALAQGVNFPSGNPTGTGGAGNARTDSDNFFMRNNLAGLTEIPLNDEEETTGIKTKADKGLWRFNGEIRLLAFRNTSDISNFAGKIIFERTSLTPGFAGEITYTTSDHKLGFGISTYNIVNINSELKLTHFPSSLELDEINSFSTKVNSSDIVVGGAVRLHKKLSIGGAFIFGKAFIDFEAPVFVRGLNKLRANSFGAPGTSISLHYRPTSFLSFGANYKSKRKYNFSGKIEVDPSKFNPFPLMENIKVETDFEIPTIAEAGLELKPFKKLIIAADFRFYDNTATKNFRLRFPTQNSIFAFFEQRNLSDLDVHSFHVGGKYSLNDKTNIQFGATTNSNASYPSGSLGRGNELGVVFSGAIGRRIKDQWLTAGFAVLPGRERPGFFFNNSRDGGVLFSIGLRIKQ